ncbi:MAG: DUF1178 family protein [Desulfobacterales bacterium]|jgi:hypothetical protein
MIAYDLQCINGHSFEGWFEDGKTYEEQKKNGFISCPICESTSIARIPSTFAIKSSSSLQNFYEQNEDVADINRKIVDFVEKNFDNVGTDFSREALKMHYGVIEPRNIRGVSTKEEEKTLKKEGVQFIKIPMPVVTDTDA